MDEQLEVATSEQDGWSSWTYLNALLLAVCVYLLYKIYNLQSSTPVRSTAMPKMKRRDFTVQELRAFDGRNEQHPGRILVAVNGTVFDMSNRGRSFYGAGGPYATFAGRDATRALATFSLTEDQFRDDFDDLTDLSPSQLEQAREWELQYREKYDVVGKLLKPGEQSNVYSDDEDAASKSTDANKNKFA